MLKKLRRKFVTLIMSCVATVLIVVFTTITMVTYHAETSAVYSQLKTSLSTALVADSNPFDFTNVIDEFLSDNPAFDYRQEEQEEQSTPPEIGGRSGGGDVYIPVAVYVVDENTKTVKSLGGNSALLSSDVLVDALNAASSAQEDQGELPALGLFYLKQAKGDITYYAFADMSNASSWKTLAGVLVLAGLGALAVFFLVSIFFSNWALRPVEESWSQQKRFIADASHELKTPLTVILANNALLAKHPEATVASQSQWVESTQAEATRMQELVEDLLTMARLDDMESAPHQQQAVEVNLSAEVEGTVLNYEAVAFENGVTLDDEVAEGIVVKGEPSQVHRLVSTFLDNACKYASPHTAVKITLERSGKYAVYAVTNQGPVISADDLSHVFDRFYRADKARTMDPEVSQASFGLGLAIAKQIAESLGGSVAVASTQEEGTTFTVKIPLQQ